MIKQTFQRMAVDMKEGAQEAVNTYMSSLADLTVNSKPQINALTMLAEDYLNYAEAIVKAVDDHLQQVPSSVKLPILYLIDSIIKNVGKVYITLFSRNIVKSFCTVFEKVDERTRQQMYKLRQTWNEIFPEEQLYEMDVQVHGLDPKWPITAAPVRYVAPPAAVPQPSHKIHINPKFLQTTAVPTPVADVASARSGKVSPALPSSRGSSSGSSKPSSKAPAVAVPSKAAANAEAVLLEQLLVRKRNLLHLQQEKEQFAKKQKPASKSNEVALPSMVKGKSNSDVSSDLLLVKEESLLFDKEEESLSVKEQHLTAREEEKVLKVDTKKKEPAALAPPPRIAPVSSGLVNLVTSRRAHRDPRLHKQAAEDVAVPESVKSEARSRDPRLHTKAEKRSRSSEKDAVPKSRRRSRDESDERSGTNSNSSSRHSSRREGRDKRSSDTRKSSRKSDSKKTSSRSPSKSSDSRSPSKSTSSRSPRKVASSRSPSSTSKSSSRQDRRGDEGRSPKKTSYSGNKPVSDCADSPDSDSSISNTSPRGRGRSSSASGHTDWAVNYTKGSHKARNYVRRNLPEKSPEVVSSTVNSDLDLRPEKQIRLSSTNESLFSSNPTVLSASFPEQILPTIARQDVDLRPLQSPPGKKRGSAESEDGPPPSKKNKAAQMEMLFGKQDVDLRHIDLGNNLNVEPPSPPTITSPDVMSVLKDDGVGWSKFKQTMSPTPTLVRSPAFPRSSRNDRLGRSSGESDPDQMEDTDMRIPMNGLESSKPDYKAILNTAAEQVKNGTITAADYNQVQKQVFRMHESEKIREAQRSDYTRRDTWERRPREKDYRHGLAPSNTEKFGDIDDRFPPPRPVKKTLLPLPDIPPVALQENIRHPRPMGHRMPGPMQSQGFLRNRSILGPGPRGHPRIWRPPRGSFKENTISLPPADSFILEKIAQDPMKTITIDGFGREIRFYGENAVAFLSADNPCEIAFDPGDANVIINDIVIPCSFNQPAKEVNIGGQIYSIRLGAPTRELYVNDEGFECQFNCPPKDILLATGEILSVELQSDVPPMVHVGKQRRDLVAGRVLLIVDAETAIPVFLDAKPQRFDIDGVPHVIKFADALETVLVNNMPFNIQFGGNPVPITVNGMRHYIRLSELPADVVPGKVEIVSMSHFRNQPPASWIGASGAPQAANTPRVPEQNHEPALPVRGGIAALSRGVPKKILRPKLGRREPTDSLKSGRAEDRQMPPDLLQAIQPGLPSLFGLLPTPNNGGYSSNPSVPGSYGVRQASGVDAQSTSASASTQLPGSNGVQTAPAELNIHKLLQSLYDTGLITKQGNSEKEEKPEKPVKTIHEVDFKDSKSFKVPQPAIIDILYSGIQCSSCGTRFPPEQTEKYSSHLDWHFRQNRREKDSQRKPQSRKWYYDVSDWIQFEEIDDTLEKAQNWFDTQQTETSKLDDPDEEEIQSVPASDFPEGTICELCHDKFDQFFNEDKEEWHLKDCIVSDGIPYHPVCFKDYRTSVESMDEEPAEDEDASPATESGDKKPDADLETPLDSIKMETGECNNDESVKNEEESEVNSEVKIKKEEEETENTSGQDVESPQEQESTPGSSVKQESAEDNPKIIDENAGSEEPSSNNELPESVEEQSVKTEETSAVSQIDSDNKNENENESTTEDKENKVLDNEDEEKEANDETPGEVNPEEHTEIEATEENSQRSVTTAAVVSCSIDGNLDLSQAPATMPTISNKIKINISKPIISRPVEETPEETDVEDENDSDGQGSSSQPDPSEDKPITLKPKLVGRKLKELPPIQRGEETSGLCSIM